MLGINFGNGSYGICSLRARWHCSKVYRRWASFCDKSWGKPGKQVKAFRHIACPALLMRFYHCCYFNEELTINHADSFLMRITKFISQINFKHRSWQSWGKPGKQVEAFRHISCPILSIIRLTLLMIFFGKTSKSTHMLINCEHHFCDKSRGKPGEQVKALRHIACPPLSMKISPLLLFWWRAHNQSCRFVFDENHEIDLTD